MVDRRDENRWDPSNWNHESQQDGQYYYTDYDNSLATQNLPPADNRLSPCFQQQALPNRPEERTQSRERNKLRKAPPKSKAQSPDRHSRPHPEPMVDIPLHNIPPIPDAVRRSTRTAPDSYGSPDFVPPATWVSPQRGRNPNPIPPLQPNPQRPNRILGEGSYDGQSNGDSTFLAVPPRSTSHPRTQRSNSSTAPTSRNTIPPTPAIPSGYIQSREERRPGQRILPSNDHSRTPSNSEGDQIPAQSYATFCASEPPLLKDALRHPLQIDSRPFYSTERSVQNVREVRQAQKSSQTPSQTRMSKPPPQIEGTIRPPPNGIGHHAIDGPCRQELMHHTHTFNDGQGTRDSSQEHIFRTSTGLGDSAQGLIASPVIHHSGAHSQPHYSDRHIGYFDKEAKSFLNRFVASLHIKSALRWSHPKFFHRYAIFSMLPPYSYQLPGRYYKIAALLLNPPEQYNTAALDTYIDPCLDDDEKKERSQDEKAEKRAKRDQFKYLDVFRRKIRERVEDRYVDPIDGRLGILVVQATTAVYNSRNKTTWRRTYIENISPYFVRLAYWPTATIEKGLDEWNREQWFHAGLRWLPSCIGILILLYGPTDAEGQIRNNGYYDPFPYRLWSYPKVARNVRENQKYGQVNSITHLSNRITKPRMLCFLDAATDTNPNGVLHQRQWGSQDPTYIFVSYTGVGQFERRCNDFKKRPSCRCHRCLTSLADAEALHKIAKIAAEEAGVPAYWTDQCCMSEDPDEFSTDIYSISDVVRSSHSLVIILGESGGGRAKSIPQLLSEYGNRMWTFPEAILAPPKKDILVYRRGEENRPRRLARLDIAQRELGPDDLRVRELVDHYDGTVSLSRLEIVVIALECLLARDTSIFAEGDLTYALMGLLRQRPITDRTDSAFQAFARLSLANDSDKLLERIICLLPKDQARFNGQNRHYWAVLDDFWDAKLWDIDPNCQISAIGANDTVIIDGAYAATIHWESFHRVAITTKETWSRLLSRSMLRGVPGFVSMGALLYYLGQKDAGIAFLVLGGIIMLFSPFLVLHIYGGKVWSTQPWLFGFEGHMPIKEIETKVFGFPQNRLTWTPYGSSLSEHRPRQSFLNNECRGIDPMNVPGSTRVKRLVNDGLTAEYGESRAFTLVDTNTMTVTLFEAERPPAVALLCGSEGGMQRAVMCSYDWPTQTLYRETVLRMETRVLEKMSRVGRVRLGLRRNVKGKPETWPRSIDLTQAVEDNFGHSADV